MAVTLSKFARGLSVESAFAVLAVAKALRASGKDIVELEIGDSPFPAPLAAKQAAIAAVLRDESHYCPSIGLSTFRAAAAKQAHDELGLPVTLDNVVVAAGAKPFEQLFCELILDQGDGVLVFSPYFPTYLPNILRRGARAWLADLKEDNAFRPPLAEVERFLAQDPHPRAIFLNSPHNPTGGVATQDDLRAIANLIRGKNIAVFSDEPYQHMVWEGRHHSILAEPGMLDQCVAAYTFSKSYSMSGYRLGYAISNPEWTKLLGNLINTAFSCTPPIVQFAGQAALESDPAERDAVMQQFQCKVNLLVAGLNKIPDIRCLSPGGTFYVFPNVSKVCEKLGITSHGLAMYLLEGADDHFGVACLGGECFGPAGQGFLRLSCAEPDERLQQALAFLPVAFGRTERVAKYLETHPHFRLTAAS